MEYPVHYEGFLEENGDLFDSSRASGYPFVVLLGKGKVIAGWEVALQVLRLSEMAEVLIRSDYGYGEEVRALRISHETARLVRDCELRFRQPRRGHWTKVTRRYSSWINAEVHY